MKLLDIKSMLFTNTNYIINVSFSDKSINTNHIKNMILSFLNELLYFISLKNPFICV